MGGDCMKKERNQINSFWISHWIWEHIRKIIVNERQISDKNESTKRLKIFMKLCSKKVEKSSTEYTLFIETLHLPMLKEKQILLCEEDLTDKELDE